MTNGNGWACRLETGVATVVEAAIKKVEEMKEVVVSTVEKVAEEAWEILNQGRRKLTINGLCLSVIAPPLMEKIQCGSITERHRLFMVNLPLPCPTCSESPKLPLPPFPL